MSRTVVQKSACIVALSVIAALTLLVGMAAPASAMSTKGARPATSSTKTTTLITTSMHTRTSPARSTETGQTSPSEQEASDLESEGPGALPEETQRPYIPLSHGNPQPPGLQEHEGTYGQHEGASTNVGPEPPVTQTPLQEIPNPPEELPADQQDTSVQMM